MPSNGSSRPSSLQIYPRSVADGNGDGIGERQARVEIVLDDLILLDRRGGGSVAATDGAEAVPFSP